MIGPAEIEDMRLDLLAVMERAQLYDAALAPLNRHWADPDVVSGANVSRICGLVFVRSADRPSTAWKAVVDEAVSEAGFGIVWDGDEIISLDARPDAGFQPPACG